VIGQARSPARRSPPGADGRIHDSFCNEEREEEEKKKREAHAREETAKDHWEIIRRSGVVDLELNGIINQAKKQARLLIHLLFALFIFSSRRCNQQIYIYIYIYININVYINKYIYKHIYINKYIYIYIYK